MMKDKTLQIRFKHSGKQQNVLLSTLINDTEGFLEIYGNNQFCSENFIKIIGDGSGKTKFSNLLKAAGYKNNANEFFYTILTAIAESKGRHLNINGIELPGMLLVAVLENVIPGHGFVSVKDTKQLEQISNLDIPDNERADLEKVIEKYPVRLSRHTIRQMMVSKNVAYQYMPFVKELETIGHTNTWIGQFHEGLLEQMYQNRVIFLLNMTCPVYCRFCFRKHKDSRNEKNPTQKDVMAAVQHIKNSPSIKEIVVTGGDPFLNRKNMAATIDGLMTIDHVQCLRLATRSISYYPELFLENESSYLKYIKQKNLGLQQHGKRMEVATHFIHPDEISPESLDIISDLVKSGIAVYVQTPFLNNCNDKGPELVKLYSLLRGAGAELHYIYIPCSPIHGNSIYWKALSYGINIAKHLRAHLSDRVIPRICTATPIGKMDWFSSGWAVEEVADNKNFIWIRTPYTPEYFKVFAPIANELDNIRVNKEGTIDIQYMAKIGDKAFLLGNRPPKTAPKNPAANESDIEMLKQELATTCQKGQSIVDTGMENLSRLHETRVLIHPKAGKKEMAYIEADHLITDVIVASDNDAVDSLYEISRIIKDLRDIPHVNAVRLYSTKFASAPETYTRAVINTLGDMNHLSVVNPLRLEIETWFVHDSDIGMDHAELARRLANKGITVYCNAPLLGGVNDNDTVIHNLAYAIRKAGIEFHHLYAAGLPVQDKWNIKYPIDSFDVVDIATKVRREGSGREIPRYIISTQLGETDYGLTSSFVNKNNQLKIRLDCYDLSYYKRMDEHFSLPKDVELDNDRPVVRVKGLIKTNNFPVS